jgi:hypothetical protein
MFKYEQYQNHVYSIINSKSPSKKISKLKMFIKFIEDEQKKIKDLNKNKQ